jgi:hypothetical protein
LAPNLLGKGMFRFMGIAAIIATPTAAGKRENKIRQGFNKTSRLGQISPRKSLVNPTR